ncbi:MAG TPA: AAA family ATPase [Myxococcota bacterium]|nr:AAA family ATPase [Myxococcota bacterium]
MTEAARAAITTILFTDLVDSTGLMQRVGDERAQGLFETHHRLLSDAVSAHGGSELQWLGDGLMVAFASTADAVRCSIAMQQAAAQQPGEPLSIRVGLNVGEVLQQKTGSGYFGTPVVLARRLCDRAEAGQILCSATVSGLLAGRAAFSFRDMGALELKGIAEKVGVCEVLYEAEPAAGFLGQTPFVGRHEEMARLRARLEQTRAGRGALAMLVGEPGIGKTRTLEEFTAHAREHGARVLWGRCYEGEGAPPFGPFAEAVTEYAKALPPEELEKDLGPYGPPLSVLAPVLRSRLPDLPAPVPLPPDEERWRLLDALTQFLLTASHRAPIVLVLDDLHWADAGTVAMLRHVVRFVSRGHLLLVGAYRDVELDRQHPLADALGALRRETEYERIALHGLDESEVSELLQTMAAQEAPEALVHALSAETDGNPFFLREVLLHLVEERKLYRAEGRWRSDYSVEELGIPEGVREVIGRRLSRLSKEANRLLSAASGCAGAFRLNVAAGAAGLEENAALDALDEALEAQLVRPAGHADVYDFTHALIRHTLYGELSPSRQVRLHRRLAEEMERVYSDPGEHAGEIATQWHRSSAIPGAERGVPHCVAAADAAEKAAAHEETASFLGMALDLLPEADARRARLLARRGLALAHSLAPEEAVRVASEAGELLASCEGSDAAADYLADAAGEVYGSSYDPRACALAEQGLRHAGGRRDFTWARLAGLYFYTRIPSDPDDREIPLGVPEQYELSRILIANQPSLMKRYSFVPIPAAIFESREDVIERAAVPWAMAFWAGEYVRASAMSSQRAVDHVKRGQLGIATSLLVTVARCQSALGNLAASREALSRATELAERIGTPPFLAAALQAAPLEYVGIRGDGWGLVLPVIEGLLAFAAAPENRRAREVGAVVGAVAAAAYAHERRVEDVLRALKGVLPAIERSAGWVDHYTAILYWVIEALWVLERRDHADVLERNLREKTLAPDFRYPNTDARLSLARLCALTGRFDEAREWFEKARRVLDEQGARPLRAIADFDEAWMEVRRGRDGDRTRALALLDAARGPFESIGMTGWLRRADELRQQLAR